MICTLSTFADETQIFNVEDTITEVEVANLTWILVG